MAFIWCYIVLNWFYIDFIWFHIVLYDFVWFDLILYCFYMNSIGFILFLYVFSMVFVWFCMVLYDLIWFWCDFILFLYEFNWFSIGLKLFLFVLDVEEVERKKSRRSRKHDLDFSIASIVDQEKFEKKMPIGVNIINISINHHQNKSIARVFSFCESYYCRRIQSLVQSVDIQ